MKFKINTAWNRWPIDHDPVIISLDRDRCNNVIPTVDAPFFNDPPSPGGMRGKPFPGLWDYEGKTHILNKLMHLCNLGIQYSLG